MSRRGIGMRRGTAAVALVVTSSLVAACGGGEDESATSTTTTSTTGVTTTTISPAALGAVLDATKPLNDLAQLLGHPLRVTKVFVGTGGIRLTVRRDGDIRENVDEYGYSVLAADPSKKPLATVASTTTAPGTPPSPFPALGWAKPKPKFLTESDRNQLDELTFLASDVDWSQLPTIAAKGIEDFKLVEGATIVGVSATMSNGKLVVSYPITGIRGAALIRTDGRGNIISQGYR